MKRFLFIKYLIAISCLISTSTAKANAAEKVTFISGAFSRSVSVEKIELFSQTGFAEGFLEDIINYSNEDKKDILLLINKDFELSLLVTSRLMNSRIGEAIIKRTAKIIHPIKIKDEKITIPAIRSGIIISLANRKGKINLVDFLKSYPNKTMAINVPALIKVIDKVDSISDLVTFFSKSPLDGLKEREIKS